MKSNRTKKGLLAMLAVITLGGGAIVRADEEVGGHAFSIGPRATFVKPKDADEGKWYGGVQARFGLGNAVGLEGSIDYRKNDYAGDTEVIVYPVQASLLVYLAPEAPVSPYILGGGGWYHTRINIGDDFHDTSYRFGPHAGGGLEIALGPSLSLDGSYRYVWLKSIATEDDNELTAEYNDSGYMVTAALNIKF